MRGTVAIVLFMLLVTAVNQVMAGQATGSISFGDMKAGFSPDGFTLTNKGIHLITGSTLWVHTPTWNIHYYGHNDGNSEISYKDIPGGREMLIHYYTDSFDGYHRVTLTDDKAVFDLTCKLTRDVNDASIEYNTGYISASPIMGCPFKAETANGEVSGVVPLVVRGTSWEDSALVPELFKKLTIDSRIGQITFEVPSGQEGINAWDIRWHKGDWARRFPTFWSGVYWSTDLKPGQEYHRTFTISVVPKTMPELSTARRSESGSAIITHKEARIPASNRVTVIPKPKHLNLTDGSFVISNNTNIVVADNAAARDLLGAQSFIDEMEMLYNIKPGIIREREAGGKSGLIFIGEAGKYGMLDKAAQVEKIVDPGKAEGYALRVASDRIVVIGHDQQGSYYAMQTLKQLVKNENGRICAVGCRISDWPSMSFRSGLLFTSNKALPFHKKLIERILSRYKMNHLILADGYGQWKCFPKMTVDFAMSEDDLREEIKFANDHFVNVIPLIQSFGGVRWMFANGQNLDVAEDPKHPFCYCPSKPETYERLFKVFDEALDIYKPEYFHIGHDEIDYTGEFPICEVCKKKSTTQHIIEDVNKIYNHLTERGVKVIMWSDELLAPDEAPSSCNARTLADAKARRAGLPKDIIIADWHYDPNQPEDYKEVRMFRDEGFNVLVCPWFNPTNIANFAKAGKDAGCMGMIHTIWAGWESSEQNYRYDPRQFTAIILAAEYAWDNNEKEPEELPYSADEEFRQQWNPGNVKDLKPKSGFTVDLSSLYNCKLADNGEADGWMNLGAEHDFSMAPTGLIRLSGDLYRFARKTTDYSAIRLACGTDAKTRYPDKVTIQIGSKAKSLLFIHTTAWSDSPDREIGIYKVHYADGTDNEIKLIYGQNIVSWTDTLDHPSIHPVWTGRTRDRQKIVLRRFEWVNPSPDKVITSVELDVTSPECGPAILAVSGITD